MTITNFLFIAILCIGILELRVATGTGTRSWRHTSEHSGAAPRTFCSQSAEMSAHAVAGRTNAKSNMRKLQDLRIAMRSIDVLRGPALDAYIITSDDEHQSELSSEGVASRDRRLKYISGFSASEGIAVVTNTSAVLWIDSQYYMQADAELACFWLIMRSDLPQVPTIPRWLKQQLRSGARVGTDPRLIAHRSWAVLESDLARVNISLVSIEANLIDHIWTRNRPQYARNTSFVHALKYAGEAWEKKVERVRAQLKELGAEAQVVTALDEVAWLLNIRGVDAPFVPVVRAYVLLAQETIDMYIPGGEAGVSDSVGRHLRSRKCYNQFCVRLHEYDQIWSDLRTKSQAWSRVLVPSANSYNQGASHAIYIEVGEKKLPHPSPIMLLKSVKNDVEIKGMRQAHVRDAAALCLFMAYLEDMLDTGKEINESYVATTVDAFRLDQPLSEGASFRTIAGYGKNGAVPHYRPKAASAVRIKDDSTLVIDSGGQYLDGTTDVTRTFHFGKPTSLQREAYTRVLAGQLSLARLVFPADVETTDMDVLARQHLWKIGMDYRHSTGHGIGSYLAVHEAPLNINYNNAFGQKFEVGNFISDEPGYYHKGSFGIRLENVLEVVQTKTKYNVTGPYLTFRAATLVPYEPKLINFDLLTPDLRKMLNEYNARVRIEVGPELKKKNDLKGFRWMMNKTGYIPEWAPPKSSCYTLRPTSIFLTLCTTVALFCHLT